MSEMNALAREYILFNPEAVAKALDHFPREESAEFFSSLPLSSQLLLLGEIDTALGVYLLFFVEEQQRSQLIEKLSLSLLSRFLQATKEEEKKTFLELIPSEKRVQVQKQEQFLEGSVGFFMESSEKAYSERDTVSHLLKKLGEVKNFSYYIYLVDESSRLVGVTSLRRLLSLKNKEKMCREIMSSPVSSLKVDQSLSEVLTHPAWKEFSALPVVNYKEQFKGVVNYKTLVKIKEKLQGTKQNTSLEEAKGSLGELYSLGFKAVLTGLSSLPVNKEERSE